MPMDTILSYIQLIANLSALVLIGWIYAAYVKNLRSSVDLKNTELSAIRTNLQLWKDKAEQLEKKTPEYLEKLLSERIKIREEELARLKDDRDLHQLEIRERNSELEGLKYELQKAKDVSLQSNQQENTLATGLNDAARLRFLNKREPLTRL